MFACWRKVFYMWSGLKTIYFKVMHILYVPHFTSWPFCSMHCLAEAYFFLFNLYSLQFPYWEQVLLISCNNMCHCKTLLVQKWLQSDFCKHNNIFVFLNILHNAVLKDSGWISKIVFISVCNKKSVVSF